MKAYITLLSTLSYLPGVIVLHDSIKRTRSPYPFWVAVSSIISQDVDDILRDRGMNVVRLSMPIEVPLAFKEQSGHWGNTFDKIHIFGLTEFSKLVYLDSDMIVIKNLDHLFEKPHLSAVAAGRLEHPDWTRLNSGLMVIKPDDQLPKKMVIALHIAVEEVRALGSNKIGDQDVINAYYSDWPERKNLHLDDGYNIFYSDLDAYIDQHGYQMLCNPKTNLKDVYVVHFIGPQKPWMKWANAKHLLKVIKNNNSCKWERKSFVMYLNHLKRLSL
ncbi:glycosyltransferase [Polaromonas sp. CG_9.11]|uniref:glycosyltransferase n=1 Tax=Polaromonas sp. CG_9.11 TaxID=2787730 RepID=UPI0018C9CB8E|nr:glycosyltransferase [Polaromonas sp. CG_9.11]MBG6076055.1 glycogenin glucosyltransferase [Polaromonas sp. CG_9.11]